MDSAEIPLRPEFTSPGLTLAITLSIGLHLLLIWYLGKWYLTEEESLSPPAYQRPLQLIITATSTQAAETPPPPSIEPATDRNLVNKPPHSEPVKPVDATVTATDSTKKREVTTAQIKRSAATIIKELTADNKKARGRKADTASSILARALNKPRTTPGIHTLADGTTRVVTEQGHTYCIKPLDDWRIIDPQDHMPASMSCN